MYYIEYGVGNYFDDDEITITDTYERDIFCGHLCMADFCQDTFDKNMNDMFPDNGSIYDMGPIKYSDGREVPNADRHIMTGGNWLGIDTPDYKIHCAKCGQRVYENYE